MSVRPRIDVSQLRRLAVDAGVTGEELQSDIVRDVTSASIAALIAAKQGAPLFTGELASGITARGVRVVPLASSISISDVVSASSPHALVMEEGRAVGATAPPLGPIVRWIRLRHNRGEFDLSWTGKEGNEAVRVAAAFLRLSIKRKGIKPRLFMEAGATAGGLELERRLNATAERFGRRLGS